VHDARAASGFVNVLPARRALLGTTHLETPMLHFRALAAISLGLCCSLGCTSESGDFLDDDGEPEVPLTPQDTGHSQNNLGPDAFHKRKGDLHIASEHPLTTSVQPSTLDPSLAALVPNLANDPTGKVTLTYAMKCMLPNGDTLQHGMDTYVGSGLIDPSNWKTLDLRPLSTWAPRDALFACMIAHLNGLGIQVPLGIQASFVALNENIDDYTMFEALFVAREIDHTMVLKVYPSPTVKGLCTGWWYSIITNRICGQGVPACGIDVDADISTECTEGPTGNWSCMVGGVSTPALKTRLKPDAFSDMYPPPKCAPIPQ
jgi:hypothetical protein